MTRRWSQCTGCPVLRMLILRDNKRAELMDFVCLFRRISGPSTAHVDNRPIIDGLWRATVRPLVSLLAARWSCVTLKRSPPKPASVNSRQSIWLRCSAGTIGSVVVAENCDLMYGLRCGGHEKYVRPVSLDHLAVSAGSGRSWTSKPTS